ncbi:uncharacterized protein TM35_000221210 [Trypanosoma theileri]|uniref:PRP1 splicing factor N-terminal domain-containing protein n=1 Tax=Trypanosoma theileri TaxID=67003 RepID=A0A1X0NRI9_9TRYP|nr:uncharacterized protein TM35_000221210 [Trypanosoma theileri]ORC87322.1 hypothetical protein TM35_000221210 [Trypanosoma theileri]
MSTAPPLIAKKDKYEQLLAKYDWRSPFPPQGYQYGIGRGAKGFSTSAELSSASGAAAQFMLPTADKNNLLDALDQMEENRHKRRKEDAKRSRNTATASSPSSSSLNVTVGGEKKRAKVLLSMEDIATIGSGITGHALVKRNARTDDMDVVDNYEFSDETAVVTASDLLRSRTVTTDQTLENILGMGSPTEQTTWITHSRALREMGMIKKAQQTLMEGCRMTGSKGPLIWKERLEHMQDPTAQRKLLEEAVKICCGCEELWILLLEHEPPHEHLHWLQQAVMACPASESLWLRVLEHIPTPRDQKKIIRKALEVTPQLPSLWAMLARLEDYETGKAIFNAAAAEHLSLQIIIEAAKFEEFHLKTQWKDEKEYLHSLENDRINSFVRQAAERFLKMDEEKSRKDWLQVARTAAGDRYVITSAYMYLNFLSDKNSTKLSVPTTWMEDLIALMPDTWYTHDVLCAIWAAMLLIYEIHGISEQDTKNKNKTNTMNSNHTNNINNTTLTEREMEVMTTSIQLAPSSAIEAALLALTKYQSSHTVQTTNTNKTIIMEEEEEEEELDRPVPTDAAVSITNVNTTSATAASKSLPEPLVCVFLRTLLQTPLLSTVEVILRIAKVLYERKYFNGASQILQLGILRYPLHTALYAAAAKTLMAMGCETEAEQILLRGTEITPADSDIAWVKLAVHRRSKHEDIIPLLEKAISIFPTSERLWLMRLEAEGMRVKAALEDASMRGMSTAPLIAELRQVYTRALTTAHCRFIPTVWCYAAVRLESNLLSNASAARALLLDGVVVCTQQPHPQSLSQLSQASQQKRQYLYSHAEVYAAFGLARSHVELRHAGRQTALEVVKETLQQLPKKDGCFTVPVGELASLSIDLEAPAARGRAAAQAVQHWRLRDPLVLASVAKVYHAAGRHQKALEQVLKAVKMSDGRCGDVVALWLKLAGLSSYKQVLLEMMGLTEEAEWANTERCLEMGVLLSWLSEQVEESSCGGNDGKNNSMKKNNINGKKDNRTSTTTTTTTTTTTRRIGTGSTTTSTSTSTIKPNSGPLWIEVAKAQDPSNVTLLGYRDSIESMLQKVMDLIEL